MLGVLLLNQKLMGKFQRSVSVPVKLQVSTTSKQEMATKLLRVPTPRSGPALLWTVRVRVRMARVTMMRMMKTMVTATTRAMTTETAMPMTMVTMGILTVPMTETPTTTTATLAVVPTTPAALNFLNSPNLKPITVPSTIWTTERLRSSRKKLAPKYPETGVAN